jgi:hypothetical protein
LEQVSLGGATAGALILLGALGFVIGTLMPRTNAWRVLGVLLMVMLSVTAFVKSVEAQALDPLQPVRAYVTADPIDPARFGLATPYGRFAVEPVQGCDWLSVGADVNTYPNWQMPPWLGVSGTDATEPGCIVRVDGRMSDVPCFMDINELCSYEAETDG